ncbi:MAG: hypothetical protein ACI88Z_001549, partial [Sphingobacteriales bacterium]
KTWGSVDLQPTQFKKKSLNSHLLKPIGAIILRP